MINLLPKPEKEKLYESLFRRQMTSFIILFSAILAGSAIFILNTYVFLKIQTNELKNTLDVAQAGRGTTTAEDMENNASRVSDLVIRYQDFKSSEVSVVGVFKELERIMPGGANLNAFSFDPASRKIILNGKAQIRDDVLLLESRLKQSDVFVKLESPLSNFLEKDNPSFNFAFYLK